MTVYAVEYPWEGPQLLFATRESAEDALINNPLFAGDDNYYICEWNVLP